MEFIEKRGLTRRGFMSGTATVLAASAAGGLVLCLPASGRAADAHVLVQYDWLMSNGQIGDAVAMKRGYFQEQGLQVEFSPGGPNSATVPPVVTGQAQLGQFSDTGQLMLARSSGVPVKILACGFRTTPFRFYSLPRAPIRTPQDFIGKRIGIQPTARYALDAILARNDIDPGQLTIVNIGFDLSPLVSGAVDCVTGWVTNTSALAVIGPDRIDLKMQDAGIPGYANVYFATDEAVESNADVLTRFIRAVAKGWGWMRDNREASVDVLCDAYPQLDRAVEKQTVDVIVELSFDANTAKDGWGAFSRQELADQLALYAEIGQFEGRATPKIDEVLTTKILDATAADRPKLG